MTVRVRELLTSDSREQCNPEARSEAELLLTYALGASRAWLIAHADDNVDDAKRATFEKLIARRAQGEPIAYLTRSRGFHGVELEVTPDVLIPRPETELLVELALARIPVDIGSPDEGDLRRNMGTAARHVPDYASLHPGYKIADLGTGSGAIALAIARERPLAHVIAIDASEAGLEIAKRNAQRNGIPNVSFALGDWCEALGDARDFDLIVSNPPYIAESDPHLCEGDLRFEPRSALASGIDGLDAIRVIVRDAHAHLRAGGWLLLEHGFEQGAAVRVLLERSGYREVFTERDLENRERVTGARANL